MIQPTNLSQHGALAQQNLSADATTRGTNGSPSQAGAPATAASTIHAEDWFAQTVELSVSTMRSQETVQAHAERVLSHLVLADQT